VAVLETDDGYAQRRRLLSRAEPWDGEQDDRQQPAQ